MTIPTDPGAALIDNVDYIFNAGATGLTQRYANLYNMFNAGIGPDNMKLAETYSWTGVHTYSSSGVASGNILSLCDGPQNLGLSLSGSTITFTDRAGSTLSASSYGLVYMKSATAGRNVGLRVTAPASANSSIFTNFGFGITKTADWAEDLFFSIYAINRNDTDITATDGDSKFGISLNPCFSKTPSTTARLGDSSAVPATDDQNAMFILGTVTESNYTSLPCIRIGTVRMRYASSGTLWSFQSLSVTDGIGKHAIDYALATDCTMPSGQRGAASGKYLIQTGTAPVFSSNEYKFRYGLDGKCSVSGNFNGDGGADGVGAGTVKVPLPFVSSESTPLDQGLFVSGLPVGNIGGNTTVTSEALLGFKVVVNTSVAECYYSNISTWPRWNAFQEGYFSSGVKVLFFRNFVFTAFPSTI